jgi:hypothetical protein
MRTTQMLLKYCLEAWLNTPGLPGAGCYMKSKCEGHLHSESVRGDALQNRTRIVYEAQSRASPEFEWVLG